LRKGINLKIIIDDFSRSALCVHQNIRVGSKTGNLTTGFEKR
jgi:hypothetical protein